MDFIGTVYKLELTLYRYVLIYVDSVPTHRDEAKLSPEVPPINLAAMQPDRQRFCRVRQAMEDAMLESSEAWNRIGRRSFIGGSDARVITGNDEVAPRRLWREKRGKAEPEDLSCNLVLGGSRLSEIAIGPSFAFTVLPYAEALPPAFINELDSRSLKRGLDCLDGFFGNLTPLFFKVDDG